MKSSNSISPSRRRLRIRMRRRQRLLVFLGTLVLFAGVTSGIFLAGALLRAELADTAIELGMPETDRREAILASPGNYLRSVLGNEKLDTLLLDIKFKHMEKIRATRDKALDLAVLNTTGQDFIPPPFGISIEALQSGFA